MAGKEGGREPGLKMESPEFIFEFVHKFIPKIALEVVQIVNFFNYTEVFELLTVRYCFLQVA